MSLIDDIRKALQGENKSEFIGQILKEQAFYDALRNAGLTVSVADPTERGRLQPYGVLSKVQKIDLVDLITEITTIKNIESLDLIDAITSISLIDNITNLGTLNLLNTVNLIKSISSIDAIANVSSIDLIDLINKISEITTIGSIASPVDPYSLTSKTKVLDKIEFTYNADGTVATVKGYEGANLKYTLTFTWTAAGSLTNIVRA